PQHVARDDQEEVGGQVPALEHRMDVPQRHRRGESGMVEDHEERRQEAEQVERAALLQGVCRVVGRNGHRNAPSPGRRANGGPIRARKRPMSLKPVADLTEPEAAEELAGLADVLAAHDLAYRDEAPTISDAEYDALKRRNDDIEARFP